jgi:hypothetical protein
MGYKCFDCIWYKDPTEDPTVLHTVTPMISPPRDGTSRRETVGPVSLCLDSALSV